MKIGVHKIAMAAPNDVSGLKCLIDSGAVDPATIVALIGKTEGNGGANDFTRGFATLSFQLLLAPLLGRLPVPRPVPRLLVRPLLVHPRWREYSGSDGPAARTCSQDL